MPPASASSLFLRFCQGYHADHACQWWILLSVQDHCGIFIRKLRTEGSNLNDKILRLQLLPCLGRHDVLQGFGDRDVARWRCEEAPGSSHQYATRITTTLGASTNQISSQLKLLSIAISSHRHHSPSVVSHTCARLVQCPSFLRTHCFFCNHDQLLSKNRDSTPSRAQSDLLVKEYSGQSHNSLADSFRSEVVEAADDDVQRLATR